MKQNKQQNSNRRVRRPLVVKLIGIISLIVLVSMGLVTGLATWFFSEDSRVRAEEQNLVMSEVLGYQFESELRSVHAGALALLDTVREFGADPAVERIALANYFDRNPEVAYIGVPGEAGFFNPGFFTAWELERGVVNVLLERTAEAVEQAAAGETLVRNASPLFGLPAALLAVPYRDMGSDNAMIVVFSTERLQEIVQSGSPHTTFAVTGEGELLAHPEFDLVELGVDLSDTPLVGEALGSTADTMQIRYRSEDGVDSFGAFRKLGFGRLTVASSIPGTMVQEAALAVVRQNLYLTGIVLLLSMLAVWFFSKTVSRPVMALVRGARQIEAGDFELDLVPSTRDELGLLTESFVQMGQGLAERERIKDTFGKFVNKEVAEQALRGQLALGGTRRTATIFFSDIRSFTAISEQLDPEAVVEFLNEYMTLMVDCVERTHGVVDKFIGDAIMAVWGAPLTQGSPEADALLAIRATLLMRKLLLQFNRDRGERAGRLSALAAD